MSSASIQINSGLIGCEAKTAGSNPRRFAESQTLEELLRTFRPDFKGLVICDSRVPATSNLGSTAAACEDLLPVRFDPTPGSLWQMVSSQMKLPAKLWLVNPDGTPKFTGSGSVPDTTEPSSGSAKIDCYRWALRRYVTSGLCAPNIAAYYVDSFWLQHPRQAGPTMHTLSNHDFFVARRAFFFDLSPWGDEAPNDDPKQPPGLERGQFLDVMRALYDRADGGLIRIGGFTPWPFKYTSHAKPPGKHDGVPTEWEYGKLISQFNGYMEADAAGLAAMAAIGLPDYLLAQLVLATVLAFRVYYNLHAALRWRF